MEPDQSPAPTPATPTNSGRVAFRAVIGFLTYVGVGWLSLAASGGVSLLVLLLIAAIFMATKGLWRGFALGVLIGVGLTLPLVGACFAFFFEGKIAAGFRSLPH